MKIKLITLFFVLTTSAGLVFAKNESKIVSPKEMKQIEEKLEEALKTKNLDKKKKSSLYLLAARELFQYRFYDKAEKYLLSAIQMDSEDNKSEAYINLIAIAIIQKDKSKVQAMLDQAKIYFTKNNQYKNKEINYYLESIENYLLPNKEVSGLYGAFVQEEKLINLIEQKDYQKAFSLFNAKEIMNTTDDFNIVIYDTLNVLLHKKAVQTLFCYKQYQKYPKAYVYNIILCGLLNDYLQQGKLDPKHLKRAESYFQKDDKRKMYLLKMLKDLK
jgi:uncharacterized protein YlxP (DUF503 family)